MHVPCLFAGAFIYAAGEGGRLWRERCRVSEGHLIRARQHATVAAAAAAAAVTHKTKIIEYKDQWY